MWYEMERKKYTFKWWRGTAGKDADLQSEALSEGNEAEHKRDIVLLYLF